MNLSAIKIVLASVAALIAVFGLVNFVVSVSRPTPIPVVLSHPLAMLAMGYLLFQVIFPRMLFPFGVPTSEQSDELRHTGNELAAQRCGGRIGNLFFRGPLIHVCVFEGGILIKPILLPAAPIFRHEIISIREQRQWFNTEIEIIHTSRTIISPVRLDSSADSPFGNALLSLYHR